jgi:hypothetical protein
LTLGGYEAIPFGIQALLDLHLDWAMMQVDIKIFFNNIYQATIFRELCDVRGLFANIVPFIKLFYGAHSSLYFQHGWHVERVTIIESSSGTKQGDPLRGPLFALVHY